MTDWTGGPEEEWYKELQAFDWPRLVAPIAEVLIVRNDEDPEAEAYRVWYPPPRDLATGHRVSLDPAWRPIETRHLPWRWKLAEYPMRWLAKWLAGNAYIPHYVSGEEPVPEQTAFHSLDERRET